MATGYLNSTIGNQWSTSFIMLSNIDHLLFSQRVIQH